MGRWIGVAQLVVLGIGHMAKCVPSGAQFVQMQRGGARVHQASPHCKPGHSVQSCLHRGKHARCLFVWPKHVIQPSTWMRTH